MLLTLMLVGTCIVLNVVDASLDRKVSEKPVFTYPVETEAMCLSWFVGMLVRLCVNRSAQKVVNKFL